MNFSEYSSRQWQLFCSSTGIKAFGFLSNAKSMWEKLLWSGAILIGIGFTIWDVHDTIRLYSSYPTVTKMHLRTDRPFNLSPVTLGYPFNPEKLNYWGLNISRISQVERFLSEIPTALDVLNFLDPETLDQHDQNFFKFLYISSLFVSELTKSELHKSDSTASSSELIQLIRMFFLSHNVSLEDLARAVGRAQCRLIKLSIFRLELGSLEIERDHISPEILCQNGVQWTGSNPSMRDLSVLSIRIPEIAGSFERLTTYWSLKFEGNVYLKSSIEYFSIHFTHDKIVTPDAENTLTLIYRKRLDVVAKPLGRYKSLSTKKFQCSSENSISNCLLRCRSNYIQQRYRCVPLFFVWLELNSTKLPLCSDLRHEFSSLDESKCVCEENCKLPCIKLIYSLIPYPPYAIDGNWTQVNIGIDCYSYPSFEEIEAISTKQFLGQLGGNLSLWIGSSFLVLLHVCVFMIQIPSSHSAPKLDSMPQSGFNDINHLNVLIDRRIRQMLEGQSSQTVIQQKLSTS